MENGLIDVGVDFETYYDADYSLKKMENVQYVLDHRFEVIGVSIKFPDLAARWITGTFDQIKAELSEIDWSKVRVVAHNARFDGSILEWKFGFKPAAYLCTMVGSRPHLVPKIGSQGLEAVSEHLNLPAKGKAVHAMVGKHRTDMTPQELDDYGAYCIRDTENACSIAEYLVTILPVDEQRLIDLTLKKYIRPKVLLDRTKLVERINELTRERDDLFAGIEDTYGMTLKDLRSRDKFAAFLRKRGVDPPMKFNKDNVRTYAFAKDDPDFKDLLTHPNIAVREVSNAKMTASSTQELSRLQNLLSIHDTTGGKLPVPMVYYGAHTGRFSGDGGINLQNLPRVERYKDGRLKRGHLRYAIKAQPGYSIIAADFSNIEARIVATLAGQQDLIDAFKYGHDVYSQFATTIYGYPVNKKDHPLERFVGKTCILGLGYGMGWKKFHRKMIQEGVIMDEIEARRIVYLYRNTYPAIPALWKALEYRVAKFCTDPKSMFAEREFIFASDRIVLPNTMPITYPDIARGGDGLYFRSRKFRYIADAEQDKLTEAEGNKLWGGSITENVSQALARIIATRAELKLTDLGLPCVMQAHDELVFHVPTGLVEKVTPVIESVMTEVVPWLPKLPVAVEINHGATYGDAK